MNDSQKYIPPFRGRSHREASPRRLWPSIWALIDSRAPSERQTIPLKKHLVGRIFSLSTALIVTWILALFWGERHIFATALNSCEWHRWEQWPSGAQPHHVVMLADPQLVDPHTYPGRPWPLSTLGVAFSDLYLRRSYKQILKMHPDTLFFLGDLFDGGREWSTAHSISPDARYKGYGNKFWLKEYSRFQRIFVDRWRKESRFSREPRGRKLIASLPGNHDLGFASGVQIPVKERFEAYFGIGNRIDVIGNHSFISVDTVSLSAMDQADPATGSSGAGDGTSQSAANREIWGSAADFLSSVRESRGRLAQLEYHELMGQSEQIHHDAGLKKYNPTAIDIKDDQPPTEKPGPALEVEKLFPSILLTHVPLYRAPNTDCGPQRERGHAIAVEAGYQYQNVLTPLISKDLVTRIGVDDLTQVYSGDDHDYCEVLHGEYTGSVREITVKSMSMAMGVKRPGFVAVSLWNPITTGANSSPPTATKRDTIQNQLCLLPDQIGILMRYVQLIILTLILLGIQTLLTPVPLSSPLLPTSTNATGGVSQPSSQATSTLRPTQHNNNNSTIFRHATTNPSSSSSPSTSATITSHPKLSGYGNLPPSSRSTSPSKHREPPSFLAHQQTSVYPHDNDDEGYGSDALSPPPFFGAGAGDEWGTTPTKRRRRAVQRYRAPWRRRVDGFMERLGWVAGVAGVVYLGFLIL